MVAILIVAPVLYYGLAFLIVIFVAQPVRVEGKAMMPGLKNGDKVFMKKRFSDLNRSDIVVHYYPLDTDLSYIKRIIGLPGETLMIEEGKISINGTLLEEPYLPDEWKSHDSLSEPVKIPDGHYFVLGDNRRNSSDSRYWGTVPLNLIYGKYWFRYWEAE
ncbi:MAG: signal peptidase I [Acidobacteriota bacterium]|nr:signal peptidase I [Acidobacteriota bacterium]